MFSFFSLKATKAIILIFHIEHNLMFIYLSKNIFLKRQKIQKVKLAFEILYTNIVISLTHYIVQSNLYNAKKISISFLNILNK